MGNTNSNADGYFKEDLKVDVGTFSLDMLDFEEEETHNTHTESADDTIVDAVKNNKKDEDEE
jgi:hypothetical protein